MVWDGKCSFCKKFAERFEIRSKNSVEFISYQVLSEKYPNAPEYDYQNSVYFLETSGSTSGAEAIFNYFNQIGIRWPKKLYNKFKFFSSSSEFFYRLIANNRRIAGALGRFFFGSNFLKDTFNISGWVFGRLLGLVGLIAFFSIWSQAESLISSKGIIPFSDDLNQVKSYIFKSNLEISKWLIRPSLLWISQADIWLNIVILIGVCSSFLLIAGLIPHISIMLSWISYLSIAVVSEPFLNFQWDALLLETYFLSFFFVPWKLYHDRNSLTNPPILGRWLLWLLVFKLMFESGVVKFTFYGDDGSNTWRDLTALNYHFWTQPIPSWISYYIDKLPLIFDKLALMFTYFCELVIPFFIFFPRKLRRLSGLFLIIFQLLIILSGNYGFFNILTIIICITLFDDQFLKRLHNKKFIRLSNNVEKLVYFQKIKFGFSLALLICFLYTFLVFMGRDFQGNMASNINKNEKRSLFGQKIIDAAQVSRSMNAYGLFRVMTTTRPEIFIELQSQDSSWSNVDFNYKPGVEKKRPKFFFPHMPRLDWQMWFEALYLQRLVNNPFEYATYQRFLTVMVNDDIKYSSLKMSDFINDDSRLILKKLPFNEQRSFINRLNRSINIHLNSSYWFARMLSEIANGKENYFKIDRQNKYVKMRISLKHYSFDHLSSGNENWWKINSKKNMSFTIEL
tara:strand:+ start:4336 stop:6372 length:2037 start_codon:yes stop_codon:yes gene_type:complete